MILILVFAIKDRIRFLSPAFAFLSIAYIVAFSLLGGAQLMSQQIRWATILYGLRTYFLHLALPFIMASVLTSNDLIRVSRWSCYVAIGMLPLIVLQFESDPGAWVNQVASGEGWGAGGQISSALGRIRPPGSFSYNLGVNCFYTYVAAICLANEFIRGLLSRILTRISLAATVMVAALSGSRTMVSSLTLVTCGLVFAMILNIKSFARGFRGLIWIVSCLAFLAAVSPLFISGLDVLQTRFSDADVAEQYGQQGNQLAYLQRISDGIANAYSSVEDVPIIGRGLGLGTNVGSQLEVGSAQFLLAEDEWPRIVMEAGPILGASYLLVRVIFAIWLFWRCFLAAKAGYGLPILLWSASVYNMVFGQTGPPMNLGLYVFIVGLCLTSLRFRFDFEFSRKQNRSPIRSNLSIRKPRTFLA